jgi:catechol 2,3-dioxygenase-like lactoylglutathione lyase family enzyme
MARVVGIGGYFFKSKDPDQLRAWYRDVMGLDVQSWGGVQLWNRAADGDSFAVWSPFKADTKYFDPSTKETMLNLRVDDLEGLLAQLRERGANVPDRRSEDENGKFGYVLDPEGNLLELWEPVKPAK